ncbi:unnamed protein product [Discosporangium mesarthrocarpum]
MLCNALCPLRTMTRGSLGMLLAVGLRLASYSSGFTHHGALLARRSLTFGKGSGLGSSMRIAESAHQRLSCSVRRDDSLLARSQGGSAARAGAGLHMCAGTSPASVDTTEVASSSLGAGVASSAERGSEGQVSALGGGGRTKRTRVKEIMEATDDMLLGRQVVVKGWVRTKRDQKAFSFVEVNDGSCMAGLQVVVGSDVATYPEVERLSTGASVAVRGEVVESPGKNQRFEVKASEVKVLGECPADYPLQKKRHSLEFLRGIAHLRPRTNTIAAVARVRSALAQATHDFFRSEGFVYLQSPLITASDCEGAGEMFRVTTLPGKVPEIPILENGEVDYSKDFFGKPAFLTVSGQVREG